MPGYVYIKHISIKNYRYKVGVNLYNILLQYKFKNRLSYLFKAFIQFESSRKVQGGRILPQICNEPDEENMKHVLKQMQYRFAVTYETLSMYVFSETTCFPVHVRNVF